MARILLVEDNRVDIALVRESIANSGRHNSLDVVEDGEAALEFVHRVGAYEDASRPDLVLLDLNLPKVSGHQVLDALKRDPDLRRIPVVVMTSSESETDVRRCYELSANAYVTKPLSLDRYNDTISSLEEFWFGTARLPPAS